MAAPKHTEFNKILKQRSKNPLLSQSDQAKLNGISRQALNSLLKRHGVSADAVAEYKTHRADLFAGKQEMVLSQFDEPAVKRMVEKAPMAAVSLFGVLYDKERLETGQSTGNLAVVMASTAIDAAKQWED